MTKSIYDLKLHEEIEVNNDTFVMRVPNGFLYTDIWYREKAMREDSDDFTIATEREEYFVTTNFCALVT